MVLLASTVAGLVVLHLNYPLPYVYRLLAYRDSDFDDIHRFPARTIDAAVHPRELAHALGPESSRSSSSTRASSSSIG